MDLGAAIPAPDALRPSNRAPVPDDAGVVGETSGHHEVIVVAGFGRSAEWYRNVLADKATEVAIGREPFAPSYRELDPHEAAAVLA
jgi:hypothetical protein